MKLSECLSEAADILEQYGWKQGYLGERRREAPHCMIGAIAIACPERWGDYTTSVWFSQVPSVRNRREIAQALGFDGYDDPGPVMAAWNDGPGRTAEQVISRLRHGAEIQKALGQ